MRLTLAIVFIATTLAAQDKAGEGVWRNYDFTPGKTVWVATDFSEEPVGRFPESQLEFVKGNMQIVELDGEKVLEVSTNSVFRINLPEELPEGFTSRWWRERARPIKPLGSSSLHSREV